MLYYLNSFYTVHRMIAVTSRGNFNTMLQNYFKSGDVKFLVINNKYQLFVRVHFLPQGKNTPIWGKNIVFSELTNFVFVLEVCYGIIKMFAILLVWNRQHCLDFITETFKLNFAQLKATKITISQFGTRKNAWHPRWHTIINEASDNPRLKILFISQD